MNPIAKRTLTGLTIAAGVIAAILLAPPIAFPWAFGALTTLAIIEYVQLLRLKIQDRVKFVFWGVIGSLLLVIALSTLPWIALKHGNYMLLYVMAIIKFSDTGGFVFGLSSARLLKGGNHKLCPTISPGKSWEGLLGSLIFSTIVSCAFLPLTHFSLIKAISFGIAAALVGTFGDLVESKFKRWVGVKDSSTMRFTNGMGGVLDMLDSLLFAPAVLLPFL